MVENAYAQPGDAALAIAGYQGCSVGLENLITKQCNYGVRDHQAEGQNLTSSLCFHLVVTPMKAAFEVSELTF